MRYNNFEDFKMKDLLQGIEMNFVDTSFAIVCFLGDWVIENLYNFWSWISAAFNSSRYYLLWTFPCLLRKCSSNLLRIAGQREHFFRLRFSFTLLLVFRNWNKLTAFLGLKSDHLCLFLRRWRDKFITNFPQPGHCFGCRFDMLKKY